MGYSGVLFGGIWEVYPLVELLGEDGGADIGYSNGISYGNRYGNIEGCPL